MQKRLLDRVMTLPREAIKIRLYLICNSLYRSVITEGVIGSGRVGFDYGKGDVGVGAYWPMWQSAWSSKQVRRYLPMNSWYFLMSIYVAGMSSACGWDAGLYQAGGQGLNPSKT